MENASQQKLDMPEHSLHFVSQIANSRSTTAVWKSVGLIALGMAGITVATAISCSFILFKYAERTRFMLVSPNVSLVARPGELSDGYIKEVMLQVAKLNSAWTFESVKANYEQLFTEYYDESLRERTKKYLEEVRLFDEASQHRVARTFRFDEKKSEFHWCQALNMACGIVTGTENVFTDLNVPFESKEVSYLMFAKPVEPVVPVESASHKEAIIKGEIDKAKVNFFAVKVTRLVIDHRENLVKYLEAAKQGKLPTLADGKDQ